MATLPQQFGKASSNQRLSVQNGTAAHLSMKSKGTFNFEVQQTRAPLPCAHRVARIGPRWKP